jgi:hypothetical protein
MYIAPHSVSATFDMNLLFEIEIEAISSNNNAPAYHA